MLNKVFCNATTRVGVRCKCKAQANGKCRLHGGLSTGPKTTLGKAIALSNLRQYKDKKDIVAKLTQLIELKDPFYGVVLD